MNKDILLKKISESSCDSMECYASLVSTIINESDKNIKTILGGSTGISNIKTAASNKNINTKVFKDRNKK